VGYVGGIAPWSGIKETLSTVVPMALSFDPGIEFHVYGDGPDAPMISQIAKNQHAIKYFGEVSYKKVPAIIRTFTIGLIPFLKCSLTDQSCPMKLFEYWAAGVPVVSTDLYEVRRIAEGAVLFANDFYKMADCIKMLLSDETLRNRLRSDGFDKVLEYEWSHISARLLEVIFSLIEKSADAVKGEEI
jgi:glycosyltransferase involved in cell wall biosynthesis